MTITSAADTMKTTESIRDREAIAKLKRWFKKAITFYWTVTYLSISVPRSMMRTNNKRSDKYYILNNNNKERVEFLIMVGGPPHPE